MVVLDTNVVLDWLVFDDPAVRAMAAHIVSGQWRWIGTDDMQRELRDVLGRPAFERFGDRLSAAQERATRHCTIHHLDHAPGAQGSDAAPRCPDPDDQKFIDLAIACGATFLFSRDKALLSLARRAAVQGVRVVHPARWCTAVE